VVLMVGMQAVVGRAWKAIVAVVAGWQVAVVPLVGMQAVVDRVWMAVVAVVEEPVVHSESKVQKAVPGMVQEREQQEVRVELRDPDWLGCWSWSLRRKSRSVRSVRSVRSGHSARLAPVDRRMREHCRSHHQAQA